MDLNKFKGAFEKMNYDAERKIQIKLKNLSSFWIITESADIETASDFISAILESDDKNVISSIFVQESINEKFKQLLQSKVKNAGQNEDVMQLSQRGFEAISGKIVLCPRSLIADQQQVVSYEVFRTTKEAVALTKGATSVSLWAQNVSISFELINVLSASQIWLNSSFGTIHENIPFLESGKKTGEGALIEVAGNTQFLTTFSNENFKTVVIPFGETFAN